jgi:glycosyltransferase involved in cell wall biosynthesis
MRESVVAHVPILSIGLPVYNGANFIKEHLESLAQQTFKNYELIISDNGSTDATLEIVAQFAANDPRIRVVKQEKNLGASRNFNLVFEESRCKYFKWTAHDDILKPDYLARCIETLEGDSELIGCTTEARFIDENGCDCGLICTTPKQSGEECVKERIDDFVNKKHRDCIMVFGVFRREVLAKTRLIAPYTSSDEVLIFELLLAGRVGLVDEVLFENRKHSSRSMSIPSQFRMYWFETGAFKFCFSSVFVWNRFREMLGESQVPLKEKWALYGVLVSYPLKNGRLWLLVSDAKQFFKYKTGMVDSKGQKKEHLLWRLHESLRRTQKTPRQ